MDVRLSGKRSIYEDIVEEYARFIRLGVLREGALADVIVIDLQKPHLQPVHDIVSNLVYCGKAADVETVVVDGRLVVENRRLLHIDLPSLYERVGEAVRRITAK